MTYNRLERAVFSQDSPLRFAETVVHDIDFKAFTFTAFLADGTEIHRSEAAPSAKDQRFAGRFGTFMYNFVMDALGISGNIGTRFV